MSGSSAKAAKREIRRAFGPEALQTISEQETSLLVIGRSLSEVAARLHAVQGELDTWTVDTAHNHAVLQQEFRTLRDAYVARERAQDGLTLRGRLRWLLTGR